MCNKNIRQSFEFARKLTVLADEGEAESKDDGCMLLYSVVRDCAYKIRAQAEREKEVHRAKGIWDPATLSNATHKTQTDKQEC